ncbi:MAG: methyltransferase, TIGR04325 family [Methylotenera sp.]|nr:methyltransferase, TIGR04325 family [Oligoflexia bacterium]
MLAEGQSIFDLGGHVGISYDAYQNYIEYPARLSWTVQDVPSVVAEGRALAERNRDDRIKFVESFEQASDVDLLLVSGSLQYIDIPLWKMVSGLPVKPKRILVNMTPLPIRKTLSP